MDRREIERYILPLFCFFASCITTVGALWENATDYRWGQTANFSWHSIRLAEWAVLVLAIFCSVFLMVTSLRNRITSGSFVSPSRLASDRRWMLRLSLIILVGNLTYLFLYYRSAYNGYYLQRHDFVNLAAALNDFPLLRTPFVQTGPSGSFLGHHFSPILLILSPLFRLASLVPGINYGFYLLPLFAAPVCALFVLLILARRELKDPILLPVVAWLAFNPLLLRLFLSFHFEAFVLPLTALCLYKFRSRWYWVWLILLCAVKEDLGLYVFLIATGAWLGPSLELRVLEPGTKATEPTEQSWIRSRLRRTAFFALAFFLFAVLVRRSLAGTTGMSWSDYWTQDFPFAGHPLTAFLLILTAGGWIALLQPAFRYSFAGIALIHLLSNQPWHNSYETHYVYSILPLLLVAFAHWLRSVSSVYIESAVGKRTVAALVLLVALASVQDRSTPIALFKPGPDIDFSWIPGQSCVRSSDHLAVRIPLNSRIFPLNPEPRNPMMRTGLCLPPDIEGCTEAYLLLETQDWSRLHDCVGQFSPVRQTDRYSIYRYGQTSRTNSDH